MNLSIPFIILKIFRDRRKTSLHNQTKGRENAEEIKHMYYDISILSQGINICAISFISIHIFW